MFRTMANVPNAIDPALLRALIFANAEMQLELRSHDPNTASISSLTTHHQRDLSCLTSPNPHPWSHIRRKHRRVWSQRHFTQPPDSLDVPIDTDSAHYQPLTHLVPCQRPPPSRPFSLISRNPHPPSHAQDSSCHVTSEHDGPAHKPATSRTRDGKGEHKERLAGTN
jgi:hypothetical protein